MKKTIPVLAALTLAPAMAFATVVVNDDFSDGRSDAGPLQADWFASSSSSAIEYNAGDQTVGLVSGSSGRQIHALFPTTYTLGNVGDSLTASVTFTTPASISTGGGDDLKIGLFDHLGRDNALQLRQDTSYSSSSPNADFSGLFGYNLELDVEPADPETDLQFRRSDPSTTGRLLATNTGISSLGDSGPDVGYVFAPNTTYTVDLSIVRTASGLDISSTFLGNSHSVEDTSPLSYDFGMLAMGASSDAFGSSSSAGDPDNGIDISSFTLDFSPIPEPSTSALLLGAFVVLGMFRRRK